MSWKPNEGFCPALAIGKRVKVRFADGSIEGDKPVADGAPAGWPADETAPGKGPPMDWRKRGSPLDVAEWDFA